MPQPLVPALQEDGELLIDGTGNVGQTLFAQYERVPIGSSHDDSRTFGGDIAEVLLFNRNLSETEQAGVERYLALHYGLITSPDNLRPHTNFRISASGEDLLLTRPDGTLADFVPRHPGAPRYLLRTAHRGPFGLGILL